MHIRRGAWESISALQRVDLTPFVQAWLSTVDTEKTERGVKKAMSVYNGNIYILQRVTFDL